MFPALRDSEVEALEAEFKRYGLILKPGPHGLHSGCCRVTLATENERLAQVNRDLELELVRIKAVSNERIKILQDENTTYVARIATLEEARKQDKEEQNLRIKEFGDLLLKLSRDSEVRWFSNITTSMR
jgi:hypothetical protein